MMTEPSEERVEAGAKAIAEWNHDPKAKVDQHRSLSYRAQAHHILAAADAVDTRDTRIASLEAENERLREAAKRLAWETCRECRDEARRSRRGSVATTPELLDDYFQIVKGEK